ncbi:MAG: TIGR04283 family arsenosugar biosynthesis glycosyltransferase [Rhodospirillales bacterium]|nr:TIGR04283 family arsenosugar biosynthesis glycosyltransferase [Rhodospirillales bacterium]
MPTPDTEGTDSPTVLSIIIPTLNAAATLPAALQSLNASPIVDEVIIADGGSTDDTHVIAADLGAVVLDAPRGRGSQMAAGAVLAKGAWLLFLHADTRLEEGWEDAVKAFMAHAGNVDRAACFRFALDDDAPATRRIERLVAWRCRVIGLPYGDQGLLIARSFHDALGGFRPQPLMEDVEIIRRIGKSRLVILDSSAVTSAERYRQEGYTLRPLRNLFCLALYVFGVPPRLIEGLYR